MGYEKSRKRWSGSEPSSIASMLTQIYEVSTFDEARAISEIGVDHIGVLVGRGEFPRELAVEAAAKVAVGIVPPSNSRRRS